MDWNDLTTVENEGLYFKLVGMTFTESYPQSLLQYRDSWDDAEVTLERDPHNEYDSNAIKVFFNKEFVGHVPRDVALTLANKLDNGMKYSVEVTGINVTPGKESNPGATIRVKEL